MIAESEPDVLAMRPTTHLSRHKPFRRCFGAGKVACRVPKIDTLVYISRRDGVE